MLAVTLSIARAVLRQLRLVSVLRPLSQNRAMFSVTANVLKTKLDVQDDKLAN